jgi:hypothetical protein
LLLKWKEPQQVQRQDHKVCNVAFVCSNSSNTNMDLDL